tara:strand:+ start:1298 stop:1432 length:135 start_codon:yes stop_codon:yes gene_type:complete
MRHLRLVAVMFWHAFPALADMNQSLPTMQIEIEIEAERDHSELA